MLAHSVCEYRTEKLLRNGRIRRCPLFLLTYFGQMFGPNIDLIGSLGTAFGCSIGVAMCSYVLTRKKAPNGALKT